MKNTIIKLGGILFAITFGIALLLAGANMLTKDAISENTKKAEALARQEVLPDATEFNEVNDNISEGLANGDPVGWCVKTNPIGFGGELSLMVGIKADGSISGVQILSHSETPGLGARAESDPDWRKQFTGKHVGMEVKKSSLEENDIQAITGATVTSSAVTKGVNDAYAALEDAGIDVGNSEGGDK